MPRLSKKMKALVTENMRSIILEMSEQIIIRDGLDCLTIKQIAEEAEVSTGSIYNYFQNKEEIIAGIMESTFQRLLDNLGNIANMNLTASEKLYKVAFFMFEDFPRVHRLHEALMHRQPPNGRKDKRDGHRKLLEILTKIIKQGIKEENFIDCDPKFSASAFFGIIREIQMNPGRLFADVEPVLLAEKVIKIYLSGIKSGV